MTFISRKIRLTLSYGTGNDGLGTPVSEELTDHRVSVNCRLAGGAGLGQASVRIFGMTRDRMYRFSTVGLLPTAFRANTIAIDAGDDTSGLARIFEGTIVSAYMDTLSMPEVAFNVTATAGLINALKPCPPSSYRGSADVAVVLGNLAAQMGVPFENNGVSVILSKPYFPGTARDQAASAVSAAGIEWNGMADGTLAIWRRGSARGGSIPLISPDTGMVGYPAYTPNGILVTSQFNPNVRGGAKVQVKSSFVPACGTWQVVTLIHDIEAQVPGGRWFTQMQLAALGYVAVA